MKIWSATIAFSSMAFHPDGSRLFERSVFYGSSSERSSETSTDVAAKDQQKAEQESSRQTDGSDMSADVVELEQQVQLEQNRVRASRSHLAELSTIAWLTCSSNNVNTHVFLVDLRQPAVLLQGFTMDAPYVAQNCAVPGAKPTDIIWQSQSQSKSEQDDDDDCVETSRNRATADVKCGWHLSIQDNVATKQQPIDTKRSSNASDNNGNKSLLMPTMWFGAQDGSLFIYSTSGSSNGDQTQLPVTLARIQLASAPTSITHVAGRVFVALTTTEIVMFHRNPESKEWVIGMFPFLSFTKLVI